jgi:hypothetical protein
MKKNDRNCGLEKSAIDNPKSEIKIRRYLKNGRKKN